MILRNLSKYMHNEQLSQVEIDGAYLHLPESEELELRRRRRNLSNFLGAGDSFFRLEAGLCAPPPPARFSSAARLYDGETLPTV